MGCVQCYYYFNRYKEDSFWIKTLVFLVWALDTTHQGLITHTAYTYLVTEYGDLAFLGEIVPTLLIEVIVSGLVVLLVQSFFVLRVWKCACNLRFSWGTSECRSYVLLRSRRHFGSRAIVDELN